MKKTLLFVLAGAICTTPLVSGAEPPPVIQIARETIKEGRLAAHEKVESDWARAARRAKLQTHYLALSAMTGANEVWFLMAYPSFAAVEASEQQVEKTPSLKSEMETLDAHDGEQRSASRSMYAVYRKDLSYRPEAVPLSKTRYMIVESFRVKLGKTSDFLAGAKQFLAAHEKANSNEPSIAYEVIAGAPDGLFLFLSPMESLKTMDEHPAHEKSMIDAMGKNNFEQLMRGTGDVFLSMETALFSINPRMSYVSRETEDGDPDFWRPKAPVKPTSKVMPKAMPAQ
jgi:hypothetical protein